MKKALFILWIMLLSARTFPAAHENTPLIPQELNAGSILWQIKIKHVNSMTCEKTNQEIRQELTPESYAIFTARKSDNPKSDLLQLLSRATVNNWNPVYLEVIERYLKELKEEKNSCVVQ